MLVDDITVVDDGGEGMPRVSRTASLLTFLMALVATGSEAKVLRSKDNASDVLVFKDADAMRRFGKLTGKSRTAAPSNRCSPAGCRRARTSRCSAAAIAPLSSRSSTASPPVAREQSR